MSWTDWTKYLFGMPLINSTKIYLCIVIYQLLGSLECEKKFVTPLDVMLYQIKYIIIIPMQALGTGMGEFGSNMFSKYTYTILLKQDIFSY